jgi:hypothetical protein
MLPYWIVKTSSAGSTTTGETVPIWKALCAATYSIETTEFPAKVDE